MLRIKLIRSVRGHNPRNRRTVEALGLRKIRQTVDHVDTPAIRGMIHHVKELLEVTQVADAEATPRRSQKAGYGALKAGETRSAKPKKVKVKVAKPKAEPKAAKPKVAKVAAKPAAAPTAKAVAAAPAKPKAEPKAVAAKAAPKAKPAAAKTEKPAAKAKAEPKAAKKTEGKKK